MNKKYSRADNQLNIIIVVCVAVVLLATVACILVQKFLPEQSEQSGQQDAGVLITDEALPGMESSGSDVQPDGGQVDTTTTSQTTSTTESASSTESTDTTDTTTDTTTTTQTTAATSAQTGSSSYDVTIKDSEQVRTALTQMMTSGDLALLDSILSSGTNTASESSSESTYDVNGRLCIVDSEMQAVKYEYYVPGAGERVILVCASDGRVYVGLVTGSEMHYYTNDTARSGNAPKCISGYAAALSLAMKNMSA